MRAPALAGVSFRVRENETIAADRAGRRTWLEARNYRVIEMWAADVERDLEAELARLQAMIAEST